MSLDGAIAASNAISLLRERLRVVQAELDEVRARRSALQKEVDDLQVAIDAKRIELKQEAANA
jgi:uncharacterized protein YlxW (UPF0749 family)